MNIQAFGEHKTGELVPIKINTQDDWAFIPNPLPPNWEFPSRLWPMLAEAREALARLDAIGRVLPDTTLLMTPLRRREALTSSALEGTFATPEQLVMFEIGAQDAALDTGKQNEWREVANYHRAINQGVEQLDKINMPFCLRLFKMLHSTLLDGVPSRYKNPGEFRGHQVVLGSDRRYVPPPNDRLEKCLDDLEKFINAEDQKYDPLVRAYLVHYQFEAIHPFYDGNGRIGRVLLSLMIAKWRNDSVPWLYMSAFFERFKDEYIAKMFNVSAVGAWEDWIEFCLRGTIRQANDSVRRCEELQALQADFMKRIGAEGSQRTPQIITGLFTDPIVLPSTIQKRFGVTYPTAKAEITRLESLRILRKIKEERPAAYFSPEVFQIAYSAHETSLS
jgi:Fic family protein